MPESFVRRAAAAFFRDCKEDSPARKGSATASALCERIALAFEVSDQASMVRLAKLGYIIG